MKPWVGLKSPKGGPPLYMKKTSMSKNDFRPFGAKKKNWIWKMTLADPPLPPYFRIFNNLKKKKFWNPSLKKIFDVQHMNV